jgi:hypothetical protein
MELSCALTEKPELHTVGTVHVLCDASLKLRERDPQQALRVADVAVAIAEALSPERYNPMTRTEARAAALLERGNALRSLTRYPEALEALEERCRCRSGHSQ